MKATSAQLQTEWASLVELSYPGVKVAHGVTFEQIWTLFLDSGFLYPEKLAKLQPVMPEIQKTVRALIAENGHLLATVVLCNEGLPEAHISLLRWCERTWIVQHLAALPLSARGLDASARVNLALAYYGQLRPDVEWAKMFFRPNNPWPSRVFGGFAKQINDTATSDLRTFHYLTAATAHPLPKSATDVTVRSAGDSDLKSIEGWFTSRSRSVELIANDLEVPRSNMASLSQVFSNAGLQRRREFIVAERKGAIVGFALLEISSLGMNFSELTNAFSVYLFEDDSEARLALVISAKQRYAELGRLQCIALEEGEDLTAFETAGFARIKDYTCWTFHRSHLASLEEYFITLFGSRRRRDR